MFDAGILEASTSKYSSKLVLVPKQDVSIRLCVEYRKLNQATIEDCYHLLALIR